MSLKEQDDHQRRQREAWKRQDEQMAAFNRGKAGSGNSGGKSGKSCLLTISILVVVIIAALLF